MSAAPTAAVIQAQVEAIRLKLPQERFFGIYSPCPWSGADRIKDGTGHLLVRQCNSPLQMRLALQDSAEGAKGVVLITPLDDASISDDIRVRLARGRLYQVKPWEIVRALFRAKQLDPRVTKHGLLAELLLEHAATQELPPAIGGIVDAETVWGVLLSARLGLPAARPDLTDLLRVAAEADLARRWQASPPEFRKAATGWLGEYAGEPALAVIRCLDGEFGPKALSVGLALGALFHPSAGREMDRAAGRIERYTGEVALSATVARRWHEAATTALGLLSHPAARRVLADADQILVTVGAAEHAWYSDILPSGFEQRLGRFGEALAAHVASRPGAVSEALASQYRGIGAHQRARDDQRRIDRVEMAMRLARWLVEQGRSQPAEQSGLGAAARAYVADGAFVDWARQVLRGGEPSKTLAAAYVQLVDAVTEVREGQNARFAQLLQEQESARRPAAEVVPVESILQTVAVPAAKAAPLLVILMDGMSWGVFRELIVSIKAGHWSEVALAGSGQRLVGLAALPSVTEVCRTSLFCGRLTVGAAPDEAAGFAGHEGLLGVAPNSPAPRLFHKAALEGDEDSSLAREIREAIADLRQRVVGLVINAVDDQLDKGDQIDQVWSVQQIRVLGPVLAEAAAAARMVLLVADHGHVLDRQTELRRGSDALRWRHPDRAPESGEVTITSPRVQLGRGGSITVPCSERLRYGNKKNGYHGGVTPQEMLVPISLLWPTHNPPEGFVEVPADLPGWWTEPLVDVPAVSIVAPLSAKPDGRATPLFDAPAAKPPEPARLPVWLEKLVATEMYQNQRLLVSRARIDDQVVIRLVAALAARGGSMTGPALASAMGIPEHRVGGLVAVLQRLLNIEGYAILDRQESSNTVVLNIDLLKRQFELGTL